jgi:hypothetical protein
VLHTLQHTKPAFGEEIMSRSQTSEWFLKFKDEMTSTEGGKNFGHCTYSTMHPELFSKGKNCKSTFLHRCSAASTRNCICIDIPLFNFCVEVNWQISLAFSDRNVTGRGPHLEFEAFTWERIKVTDLHTNVSGK